MKSLLFLAFLCGATFMTVTSEPGLHGKIVACYWGAWSTYRVGDGTFDVDNIDPSLCTHGFYGFAELGNVSWVIEPVDPWYDQAPTDPNCDVEHCKYDSYRKFVALKQKNPDFVPMISIGGWNSGSGRFSMMAADENKKKIFLDSLVPFLKRYGFEGVDFDWEYPGDREGSDPENDKDNFSALVRDMSALLKAEGMLLSAAVTPSWKKVDVGYDVPYISQYFDFINVMTYDFHGWWPQVFTGHNSPLYPRPEDNIEETHPGYKFNVYNAIMHWIEAGAPRKKLVMGLPIYGRGFQLNNTEDNGLYCPAKDGIPMGPYTLQDGIWGFQEINQAFTNQTLIGLPGATPNAWTVVRDNCYDAPYAYNERYWIGYDDVASFSRKSEFINYLDIGGGMVWSIDTDDFHGTFHEKPFPLLRAMHDTFAAGTTFNPEDLPCTGDSKICDMFTPTTTTTTTTTTATTTTTTTTTTTITTTTPTTTPTTTAYNPASPCTERDEVIPYPGDCHKYFMCKIDPAGGFWVKEFDCGSWVFDPHTEACVDPDLPGNENLCDEP